MSKKLRIKLDKRWVELLLKLPESGMGYQRVDVRMADGRELKNAVVLNAELLELPDNFGPATVVFPLAFGPTRTWKRSSGWRTYFRQRNPFASINEIMRLSPGARYFLVVPSARILSPATQPAVEHPATIPRLCQRCGYHPIRQVDTFSQ